MKWYYILGGIIGFTIMSAFIIIMGPNFAIKSYNVTIMERPCVACSLWLKEYKGVSEKQLKYHLSRYELMKRYNLVDTMIIDTLE